MLVAQFLDLGTAMPVVVLHVFLEQIDLFLQKVDSLASLLMQLLFVRSHWCPHILDDSLRRLGWSWLLCYLFGHLGRFGWLRWCLSRLILSINILLGSFGLFGRLLLRLLIASTLSWCGSASRSRRCWCGSTCWGSHWFSSSCLFLILLFLLISLRFLDTKHLVDRVFSLLGDFVRGILSVFRLLLRAFLELLGVRNSLLIVFLLHLISSAIHTLKNFVKILFAIVFLFLALLGRGLFTARLLAR